MSNNKTITIRCPELLAVALIGFAAAFLFWSLRAFANEPRTARTSNTVPAALWIVLGVLILLLIVALWALAYLTHKSKRALWSRILVLAASDAVTAEELAITLGRPEGEVRNALLRLEENEFVTGEWQPSPVLGGTRSRTYRTAAAQ